MRAPTIALRYARAFLDLGIETKSFEKLGRELDRAGELFVSEDLALLFRSPKFGVEARKRVLSDLLQRLMITGLTRNFLMLLCDKDRIGFLPEIVAAFHELVDAHADRARAEVTVAQPMSPADAARLRKALEGLTGKTIVLEQVEDPSIIGGVITRIGGRVYDGSVRTQLESLRGSLKHSGLS